MSQGVWGSTVSTKMIKNLKMALLQKLNIYLSYVLDMTYTVMWDAQQQQLDTDLLEV